MAWSGRPKFGIATAAAFVLAVLAVHAASLADTVVAWGSNNYGQLGTSSATASSNVPLIVSGLPSTVSAVAAGYSSSYALANGTEYGWGNYALLGVSTLGGVYSTPITSPSLANGVTLIGAGHAHGLALQNGALYAWGDDSPARSVTVR